MKAHIIGICGKGTSATGLLLKQADWEITGSDSGVFEPIATTLANNGINYTVGYSASNIPDDLDLIVMGSSAQLSIETNEEVAKAHSLNVPIKSFAEVLQDLTQKTNNLVITGSYGKSTCTSLATHVLVESGKDPSFFIGAEPKSFGTSHLGSGPDFVLEGDEYPHDNTSRDAKFLYYNPKSILLISCAHDHINKFPTIEDYLKPYKELIKIIPKDGVIVAGVNHPHVSEVVEKSESKVATYGLENADYTASNIEYGPVTKFDLIYKGEIVSNLETTLIGEHNIENIIGVSALLLENKLVTVDEIGKSVKTFKGVKKRLELKNPNGKIPVYESFGSSYQKAKADISALKNHFPEKEIIGFFEPHTFGWRNRGNLSWYEDVFEDLSEVFVYKPPTAGSGTHDQLEPTEIVTKIKESNTKATLEINKELLKDNAEKFLNSNSIIVLITSSNFDGELENIVKVFN